MNRSVNTYSFINAKLRASMGKILSSDFLTRMENARSFTESVQLLRDTSFAVVEEVYAKTGDIKMCELELYKKEISLYREMGHSVKGEVLNFVRALAAFYEIENLKIALRLWFERTARKRSIAELVKYIYRDAIQHDLHIDDIISSGDIQQIAELLRKTPYAEIITQNAEHIKTENSVFPVEIALDYYFYHQLMKQAHSLDSRDFAIARRMIGVEIDNYALNLIARFRFFYHLPPEKTLMYCCPPGSTIDKDTIRLVYSSKNIGEALSEILRKKYSGLEMLLVSQAVDDISQVQSFERLLYQIKMHEVRRMLSGYPFTIGIILGYFVLKKEELHNIMTILNAKMLGIEENLLTDRV